ncbi:MAG: ribonuclease E activity regulator RraA [Candidatus Promineifilaceae bacterium]|nr:ribonuclease E activity regulator RraA [Candidatus Promineifilaceae bacterium]
MEQSKEFRTAELCDRFEDELQVAEPILRSYGGEDSFSGPIVTVDTFEDNILVRQSLAEPGEGRVLIVDSGGSLRRALLDDDLAALAQENGWSGIVVHGVIRDVKAVGDLSLGLLALGSSPLGALKKGRGLVDQPVHFAGVTFRPGYYLYADADGVIVAPRDLLAASE